MVELEIEFPGLAARMEKRLGALGNREKVVQLRRTELGPAMRAVLDRALVWVTHVRPFVEARARQARRGAADLLRVVKEPPA